MALALTAVVATVLQLQPSSFFTDADFHSTATAVIHAIFFRILATRKRLYSFEKTLLKPPLSVLIATPIFHSITPLITYNNQVN